jgi:hypothetical protein
MPAWFAAVDGGVTAAAKVKPPGHFSGNRED